MDLELMKSFLVLAETRNFTRAAELLRITQSTMTIRIRTLENWFGKPLFVRSPRQVELTPLGRSILPQIKKSVELLDECRQLADLGSVFERRLTIGAVHSLWETHLLDAVCRWHRTLTGTALKLVTDHSAEIIRSLSEGVIDLGLVFLPPKHPDIRCTELFRDTFIAVTAASLPGAASGRPEKERSYVHLNWGQAFSAWLRHQPHLPAFPAVEADHAGMLLRLLEQGDTWGWVLRSVALPRLQSGTLTRLDLSLSEPPPEQPVYLIRRKNSPWEQQISNLIASMQPIHPDLSHVK